MEQVLKIEPYDHKRLSLGLDISKFYKIGMLKIWHLIVQFHPWMDDKEPQKKKKKRTGEKSIHNSNWIGLGGLPVFGANMTCEESPCVLRKLSLTFSYKIE